MYKTYNEEFKRNAVDLLLRSGRPLKVLARELGVSPVCLRKWRDRHLGKLEGYPSRPPGGPTPRELADEVRRLKKELDHVTWQRDILKKAASILSEKSQGGML